ncbi:ABC transporter permease [Paenibacillus sp. MBLB4367]|uniref:ABC transporter permease n=1 Tax=Paenibacillus sp. MBLB4367 TaxID=3384767 RepID=UPI003907F20C
MRLKDYFRLGWDQLKRRKVVTAMCAIGIAIGSSSIMVALAFGESISHYSEQQMGYYLKTDEITVTPLQKSSLDNPDKIVQEPITEAKMNLIRTFPNVKSVASIGRVGSFSYTVDGGKKGYINELIATELDTLEAFGSEFQQGRPGDQDNVIVLEYGATVNLIDDKQRQKNTTQNQDYRERQAIPYPVYQKTIVLTPNSFRGSETEAQKNVEIPVRVVAVLKRPEGQPDYMIEGQKKAYVSPALARKIRAAMNPAQANSADSVSTNREQLVVKVDTTSNVAAVDELIKKLKVQTMTNLHQKERMNSEFAIIRLVFAGAGLFILFVASISIVVAMTMSTYQRRRQIGIMKVLGANLGQIRNMFIVESALLGLLGGLFGIMTSYWVIWGINFAVLQFSDRPPGSDPELLFISTWVLPVGMFFALLTGVLSGIFPAIKASRTDALSAIKRE